MSFEPTPDAIRLRKRAITLGAVATAIIPINTLVFFGHFLSPAFFLLLLAQVVLGVWAMIDAIRAGRGGASGSTALALAFGVVGLGGPLALGLAFFVLLSGAAGLGGAWGRPLRLRGRIVHPSLTLGSDWTAGARPSALGLDVATRRALEALWLHDAQKEHASVPAFSRVSWLLAGLGAPPDLLEAVHRAAIEEIDHARRCFALAEGYGGRAHTAEPMPELLLPVPGAGRAPFVQVAVESLKDGCLLEGFNADVAERCPRACEEPVTRAVLEQIAREERDHARLSWRILAFCVERGGEPVRRAIEAARRELAAVARPTAVGADKAAIVALADAAEMRRHGRIAAEEWAEAWAVRVAETEREVGLILDGATESVAA